MTIYLTTASIKVLLAISRRIQVTSQTRERRETSKYRTGIKKTRVSKRKLNYGDTFMICILCESVASILPSPTPKESDMYLYSHQKRKTPSSHSTQYSLAQAKAKLKHSLIAACSRPRPNMPYTHPIP